MRAGGPMVKAIRRTSALCVAVKAVLWYDLAFSTAFQILSIASNEWSIFFFMPGIRERRADLWNWEEKKRPLARPYLSLLFPRSAAFFLSSDRSLLTENSHIGNIDWNCENHTTEINLCRLQSRRIFPREVRLRSVARRRENVEAAYIRDSFIRTRGEISPLC